VRSVERAPRKFEQRKIDMSMFNSDAEFEAYVAQQQAELAGGEEQPSNASPAKGKSAFASWHSALIYVLPLVMIAAAFGFHLRNQSMKPQDRRNAWDKILGTTAWATGREYNANASSITEQFTLKKKKKK